MTVPTTVDLEVVQDMLDKGWVIATASQRGANTYIFLLRNPHARGLDAWRWFNVSEI